MIDARSAAALVIVFVLGAVLGSFFNVVIYRLPRGLSLVRPGSRCPSCGTAIRPWDNIPILSYLLLRGRCRSCGAMISWRYPVVELTAALLLLTVWLRNGPWLNVLTSALFVLMLVPVFFIDLEHQIVPDVITYPGLVAGLILAVGQGRVLNALLSAAAAGAVFFLIAVVSRGGMGGGDVKLAAVMGAFLGWPAIAVAFLAAFILGAVAGLLLIATGRRSRKDPIPFGPSLAVGGLIALFFAPQILRWYLAW